MPPALTLAKANGMVINPNVGMMTLAGLIMGFWIFYGYYIPTFFAGEVKQAEKTLLAGSWASLIVTWAIFVVAAIAPAAACPAGVDRRRKLSEQCRRRQRKPDAVDHLLRRHPQTEHHHAVDRGDRLVLSP